MPLKIIPFEPRLTAAFRDLNIAWIDAYFYVEAKDVELLENCKESIIDKGGYIFFGEFGKRIVGCFAFIKVNDNVFELGKMAVDPEFQGMKIGQKLLSFAVNFAKSRHWKKIVLYSSTKLNKALYIYRKQGFNEVVMEKEVEYERSDIKMELVL